MIWMVPLVGVLFFEALRASGDSLFLTVLGMSLTASVVILAVLLARLALRKAPRVFSYALWAVVLFRLLCPITVSSPLGVVQPVQMPTRTEGAVMDVAPVSTNTAGAAAPVSSVPAHDPAPAATFASIIAPAAPSAPAPDVPVQTDKPLPDLGSVAGAVWLTGVGLLLGYSALSLLRLRRRLVGSVPLAGEKNVRLADHIPSPFVLGLVWPQIYLPSNLPESERDYVLLHERTHIRRFDHVTRALAWLALSVHWFNPLVWLAFHLAGKDMEMSCDEAVLRKMGRDVRADYSTSLLRLSAGGKLPAGPLAFGGGDPQSRIKNVLSYKKPAFWVVALALAAVLCAGAALATDQHTLLIDPDSVVSVAAVKGHATYTTTPQNTGVFTAADRRKDLSDSNGRYSFPEEEGRELVRLLNRYRKTVFTRGEPEELSGWQHELTRINCADGSFYAVDYWYWNGFSFNPLHGGEDDYTTLVTYYDAQGGAVTTWQMEYDFDEAYFNWRRDIVWSFQEMGSIDADLTFSLEQNKDGTPYVRIDGFVDGQKLPRGAFWHPMSETMMEEYPLGYLTMVYHGFNDGIEGHVTACWTGEDRTQVSLSTWMQAALSSYAPSGWWEFTVNVEPWSVASMVPMGGSTLPEPVRMYPESIPDWAALNAGRIAAKLLTAAEDFYANARSASAIGFTPVYTMYEQGRIRVEGDGLGRRAYVEWSPGGGLYFAGDPGGLCPALAGEKAEGGAHWTSQDKTALEVVFGVNDERVVSGTICGFRVQFTVDLDSGAVTQKDFQSLVEGETLELTDQEMLDMAHILAELMRGAEDYYKSDPPLAPSEVLMPVVLGVSYSLSELGNGVIIDGLDCAGAVWQNSEVTLSAHVYEPETGALGVLRITNPRFLGGYFANAYGSATAFYYPEESGPTLVLVFDDYTKSVSDLPGVISFVVDLGAAQVKSLDISGYAGRSPEFSDVEVVDMARTLAQLIQGAANSWEELSNPPAEEGPLPFDRPLRLWFGSGAGAWRTILTLHPDGSFEGRYDDADLGVADEGYPNGTEYVCTFHGRFGNIRQLSAASWSMALEELTLDTGHPVGEEWISERTRYISANPYGMSSEQGDGMLRPGAQFMLYTPEAKGYAPGDELYGMSKDDPDSELYSFWIWWPEKHGWGPYGDTLGCYALRNVETGYGFFDLSAWGIAPEQPRDY